MKPVETGAEKFAKLQPGFQKQILGPARYELYKSGTELNSFIGSAADKEFGEKHFIKPLSDMSL
jgi:hypothetical protein